MLERIQKIKERQERFLQNSLSHQKAAFVARNPNDHFDGQTVARENEIQRIDYSNKIKVFCKNITVIFDEIHIVAYGTPKYTLGNGILFDDEQKNCDEWDNNEMNMAVNASALMDFLRGI